MISPADSKTLMGRVDRHVKTLDKRLLERLLPRRTEFTLTDITTGTQLVPVSWNVPILSDYAVVVTPVSAAPFVGLLTGAVQAGSKTINGCTIIVANRSGQVVGTANFDVLAFPL